VREEKRGAKGQRSQFTKNGVPKVLLRQKKRGNKEDDQMHDSHPHDQSDYEKGEHAPGESDNVHRKSGKLEVSSGSTPIGEGTEEKQSAKTRKRMKGGKKEHCIPLLI